MKNLLKYAFLLSFACIVTSCGDDDEDGPDNVVDCDTFSSQIAEETNTLAEVGSVFTSDPSTANCEAFIAAYEDIIDVIKGGSDCFASVDQFNADIAELEALLAEITCE